MDADNAETFVCSRCERESRDDEALAWWELLEGEGDDPETWPVVCPQCFYTTAELDQIGEALRHVSTADAVREISTTLEGGGDG